jgi:threonine aldolase
VGLAGDHGKVSPSALSHALTHARFNVVHRVQPMALSLTQATEAGTVYGTDELSELCAVAKRHGLGVHMDGARFANALVATGATPAELSWKAGVDVLCLGATKNGAIAAEAVVIFDRSVTPQLRYLQKRSGHLMAKSSLVSTQLLAYLDHDLWLRNARHANRQGRRLADALRMFDGANQLHAVEANQVFVSMPDDLLEFLLGAGVQFNVDWRTTPLRHHRFSASFLTSDDEIDSLRALAPAWNARCRRAPSLAA